MRQWRAKQVAERGEEYRVIEREQYNRKKAANPDQYRAISRESTRRYRERRAGIPKTPGQMEAARHRNREYRARHKDRLRPIYAAQQKARYAANPEKHRAAVKRYQSTENGHETLLANNRNRRARHKGCPGRINRAEWLRLVDQFGSRCAYCAIAFDESNITQDHVVPLARGGMHDITNVVPACRRCNFSKGTKVLIPAG